MRLREGEEQAHGDDRAVARESHRAPGVHPVIARADEFHRTRLPDPIEDSEAVAHGVHEVGLEGRSVDRGGGHPTRVAPSRPSEDRCAWGVVGHGWAVPPRRIERLSTASEAVALSAELRGREGRF